MGEAVEGSVEETSIRIAGGSGESGVVEGDGGGCVDGDARKDVKGTAKCLVVVMVVTGVETGVETSVTRGDTYRELCGCLLLLPVLLDLCEMAILETRVEMAGFTHISPERMLQWARVFIQAALKNCVS